jgi:hypothetical protein
MVRAELERVIRQVAGERGFRVAVDTHYDAGNCQVRWCLGKVRRRVDFQPTDHASIAVTFHREAYPIWPRLFILVRRCLPFLPSVAVTTWTSLGEFPDDESMENNLARVRDALDTASAA